MKLNKNYQFIDFIYKSSRKLHVEKLFSNFITKIYSLKKTNINLDFEQAEKNLSGFSANPATSCICENFISENPEYDLQIIVPVYNTEKYLEECLESISNQQTKYNFFVVAVNDGSTDSSREILKKYKSNPQIKIIDQENKGLSGARNSALKNINARYVMFVDSDDRMAENAIENLVSIADNFSADIVEGSYYYFENEKIISANIKKISYSIKALHGFAWGKVFKAELFRHIHFPEKFWFEDTVLFLILFFMAKKVATISDIVYWYRQNNEGITFTSGKNFKSLDTYWITKQLLKDRNTLGMECDTNLYEAILQQSIHNFKRISSLCEIEIDKSFFEATRFLLAQYFNNSANPDGMADWKYSTAQKKFRNVENAIRKNNFYAFVAACFFCEVF